MHPPPCACRDCAYSSKSDNDKLLRGSKIDKLFYDEYLPLRERKLLQKLVRTRAVYDDIRTKILSSSSEGDHDSNKLGDKGTNAVNEFISLVDRGLLPSLDSSVNLHSVCCSCCICKEKYTQPNVHRHLPSIDVVDDYLNKRTLKSKKRRFKSDSCLCTLKPSLRGNRRKYERKHFDPILSKQRNRKRRKVYLSYDQPLKYILCKCSNKLRKTKKLNKWINSSISVRNRTFDKQKDSIIIHKKRLKKKWACHPFFCIPDDCIPEDCYKEILRRDLPDPNHKSKVSSKGEKPEIDFNVEQQKTTRIKKEKQKRQKNKVLKIFCKCKKLKKSISSMTEMSTKGSFTSKITSRTISTMSVDKQKLRKRKKNLPYPRQCDPFMCRPDQCNPLQCAEILLKKSKGLHDFDRCFCMLELNEHVNGKKAKEIKSLIPTLPEEKQLQIFVEEPKQVKVKKNRKEKLAIKMKKKEPKPLKVTCDCTHATSSMTDHTSITKGSSTTKVSPRTMSTIPPNKRKQRKDKKLIKNLLFPKECDPHMCNPDECNYLDCAEILLRKSRGLHNLDHCSCTLELNERMKYKRKNKKMNTPSHTPPPSPMFKVEKVNKTQKKDPKSPKPETVRCECRKPSSTMTYYHTSVTNITSTNKILTQNKAAMKKQEKRKHKKGVPSPRECYPYICVPGECNPLECAEMLLKSSQEVQKLGRCLCTLELNEIKKKKIDKTITAPSQTLLKKSQTKVFATENKIVKVKKTQKRDKLLQVACECPKSTASMTDMGNINTRTRDIKHEHRTISTLSLNTRSKQRRRSRVAKKSLPFPRKCKPFMCQPGDCNPQECAEILLNCSARSLPSERCFCTLKPKVKKKEKEVKSRAIKVMKIQKKEPKKPREPKTQKKSCVCSISTASMTYDTANVNTDSKKIVTSRTASTIAIAKRKRRKQKLLSFTKECDYYTCVPGECDPLQCTETLLRNSKRYFPRERCFCTIELDVKKKENKVINEPKATEVKKNQKKERKLQKLKCECSKSTSSMTDMVDNLNIVEMVLSATEPIKVKMATKDTSPKATKFKAVQKKIQRCFCTLEQHKALKNDQRTKTKQELKFSVCEPSFCIPEECKPIRWQKIIRQRNSKNRGTGTEPVSKVKIISSSEPKPLPKYVYTRKPNRRKLTLKSNASRKEKPYSSKSKSSTNVPGRQVVRISSSFRFDIEFYREKKHPDSARITDSSAHTPRNTTSGIEVDTMKERNLKAKKNGMKINVAKHKPLRKREDTRESVKEVKTEKTAETISGLVQCVCRKIFQKTKNTEKKAIYTQTKNIIVYVQPPLTLIPSELLPYECERLLSVPGKCNPKKCLKKIKQRNLLKRCFCTLKF